MASTITTEEINILKRKLEAIRLRIKNDPNEAILVLHAAGITTKTGKLTRPYRTILKK